MLIDLLSVSCHVWGGLVQLILTHENMFLHIFMGVGLNEWHYSIHVYVLKILACVWILNFCGKELNYVGHWLYILWLATFQWIGHDLVWKSQLHWIWVRFSPGIWDEGTTSSIYGGGGWDMTPTCGCLGLAPIMGG